MKTINIVLFHSKRCDHLESLITKCRFDYRYTDYQYNIYKTSIENYQELEDQKFFTELFLCNFEKLHKMFKTEDFKIMEYNIIQERHIIKNGVKQL